MYSKGIHLLGASVREILCLGAARELRSVAVGCSTMPGANGRSASSIALLPEAEVMIFRPEPLYAPMLDASSYNTVVLGSSFFFIARITALIFLHCSRMSDYEDDMDVDAPASVQFSSHNTDAKAKRPVADLPVEAEDNLPWSVINRCSLFGRIHC